MQKPCAWCFCSVLHAVLAHQLKARGPPRLLLFASAIVGRTSGAPPWISMPSVPVKQGNRVLDSSKPAAGAYLSCKICQDKPRVGCFVHAARQSPTCGFCSMGADDDGDVDVFYDALDDCTDADVFLDTEDRERRVMHSQAPSCPLHLDTGRDQLCRPFAGASPGGSPVSDQQSAWPLHRWVICT